MQVTYQPKGIEDAVDHAREALREQEAVARLNRRDTTLWSPDSAVQKQIGQSLGWLEVSSAMRTRWESLVEFRETARAEGFTDAVLLGMGGSSLISIVWKGVFRKGPLGLRLHVLDSTDPESVLALRHRLPLTQTLFMVASKSGTTTEPDRFHRYFWGAVQDAGSVPARQFVAITDPGTTLAEEARKESWRAVFLNPADIGGRYSALSLFGLVPAALMDLPGDRILDAALAMRARLADPADAPHLALAALVGGAAKAGRDKLTLAFSPAMAPFATWLEQLLAESTGKNRTGVVPVTEQHLGPSRAYGPDRVLARVSLTGQPVDGAFTELAAHHPSIQIVLDDPIELGGQFLLWEAATALVGRVLGINPFDQPNVQESKDNTKAMLATFEAEGHLPAVDGVPTFLADSPAVGPAVHAWLDGLAHGEYIAVMAYVPESEETTRHLEALQALLRDHQKVAVTIGYGPRFLHSTGQLHKGGPATGRFLQLTASPTRVPPVPIPGTPETFNVLIDAQARGDLKALGARERPVLGLSVGDDVQAGVAALLQQLNEILG